MNKPVLGRGLGNLMEGSKVVGQTDPSASPVPVEFSHGLGNFLRRDSAANAEASRESARSVSAMECRRLRWSLFAADALLIALVVWLIWSRPVALGWAGTAFCLLAVTLGAWLAWLAFSLPNDDASK